MGETELGPKGNKVKKALRWVAEMVISNPSLKRQEILEKAQIRFNLSPRECAFLNNNFLKN